MDTSKRLENVPGDRSVRAGKSHDENNRTLDYNIQKTCFIFSPILLNDNSYGRQIYIQVLQPFIPYFQIVKLVRVHSLADEYFFIMCKY